MVIDQTIWHDHLFVVPACCLSHSLIQIIVLSCSLVKKHGCVGFFMDKSTKGRNLTVIMLRALYTLNLFLLFFFTKMYCMKN